MKVLSSVVIGFCGIYFQATPNKTTNEGQQRRDVHGNQTVTLLTMAAVFKPPYTEPLMNRTLLSRKRGIVQDAIMRYIMVECGKNYKPPIIYKLKGVEADSELRLIEMLRNNVVDAVAPIFEPLDKRTYSEFPFVKLGDYPGTDLITTEDETKTLSVVMDEVLKAWPLYAVTLIFTAISGIIMWALDTYWNSEEFPRSFIKGSWDGFWWSFISMTTVGYGDKVPKSIFARIFSIIWILSGLVITAIFTANVTSTLTALSLNLEPSSLVNVEVAVLGNGTEYQHALEEGARPKVYDNFDDIIEAVKTREADGMLLDRYTASYFQYTGKLKTLITVKKIEFRREYGLLFSKDNQQLAECLNFFRSDIWGLVQTLTATFKLTQQKPTKKVSLFETSSPYIVLYTSLGVLLGLLLIGIVWENFTRKKVQVQENDVLEALSIGMTSRRQLIQSDLEMARKLLLETQDHFNKLEERVKELH